MAEKDERAGREKETDAWKAMTGLGAPPIVGLVILVATFTGRASQAVTGSSAAMCTAIIIGALLLVVPFVAYAGAQRTASNIRKISTSVSRTSCLR